MENTTNEIKTKSQLKTIAIVIAGILAFGFIANETDMFKSSTDQINEAVKPCVVLSSEHNNWSTSKMTIQDGRGLIITLKSDNEIESLTLAYKPGDTIR